MKNVLKYLCIAIATISITGCSSTATPSESAVVDTTKPVITISQKEGKDKENDKLNISSSVMAEEDKNGYIIDDETINTDKEEKKETDPSIMTDTSSSKSVSSVNTTSDSVNQVKSSTGSTNSSTPKATTDNSESSDGTHPADDSSNTKPGTGSASDSGSKPASVSSNSGGSTTLIPENSESNSTKPDTGGSSSGANNNNGTTNKPASNCTTVVVKDAWTETVVDKEAWVETVVDKPAWTEQVWVVDAPAHDEPIYADGIVCNSCGKFFTAIELFRNHTQTDDTSPCFLAGWHSDRQQIGTNHINEAGHYESIDHPAETHTVNHPAETHTVNHPAETKEVCS